MSSTAVASNAPAATLDEKKRGNRKACIFCKQRHLKCDGAEPSCYQCERREQPCEYNFPGSDLPNGPRDHPAPELFDSFAPPSKWRKLDDPADPLDQSSGSSSPNQSPTRSSGDPGKVMKVAMPPQQMFVPSPPVTQYPTLQSASAQGQQQTTTFYSAPQIQRMAPIAQEATPPPPPPTIARNPPVQRNMLPQQTQPQIQQLPPVATEASQTIAQPTNALVRQTQHVAQTGSQPVPPGIKSSIPRALSSMSFLLAFARSVSPFISSPGPTNEPVTDASFLAVEKAKMKTMDTNQLIKTFVECSAIAHGCRYLTSYEIAKLWADKAFEVMKYIITVRRPRTYGNLTQTVIGGIELLVYFFMGSDTYPYARSLITEAHQVLAGHRRYITELTTHRLYGLLVGSAPDFDEAMHYYRKARSLNVPGANCYETSGWVCLALMLTGRPLSMGDKEVLPMNDPLSPEDFNSKLSLHSFLDECDNVITHFAESPNGALPENQTLVNVHRGIINASRAVLLWQCGMHQDALNYAAATIKQGKSGAIVKLPYLLASSYACQVAKHLGALDLLNYGLQTLEQDAHMYPTIRRMVHELRKPVQSPIAPPRNTFSPLMSCSGPRPEQEAQYQTSQIAPHLQMVPEQTMQPQFDSYLQNSYLQGQVQSQLQHVPETTTITPGMTDYLLDSMPFGFNVPADAAPQYWS